MKLNRNVFVQFCTFYIRYKNNYNFFSFFIIKFRRPLNFNKNVTYFIYLFILNVLYLTNYTLLSKIRFINYCVYIPRDVTYFLVFHPFTSLNMAIRPSTLFPTAEKIPNAIQLIFYCLSYYWISSTKKSSIQFHWSPKDYIF